VSSDVVVTVESRFTGVCRGGFGRPGGAAGWAAARFIEKTIGRRLSLRGSRLIAAPRPLAAPRFIARAAVVAPPTIPLPATTPAAVGLIPGATPCIAATAVCHGAVEEVGSLAALRLLGCRRPSHAQRLVLVAPSSSLTRRL